MKRTIAVILMLVALVVLGVSCLPKPLVIPITPEKIEPIAENAVVKPTTSSGSIGIGAAKIWVGTNQGLFTGGGYYPGATAQHTIPIYNNYSQDIQVELLFESPSNTEDDYVSAPNYVKDWVTFEKKTPVIPANSMREILVTLQMPREAQKFAEKWEFRITVVAMGQGKVQTAVSQRWLISMR